MALGRRKAALLNPEDWVFNRNAAHYAARPAYPAPLVDRIAALAEPGSGWVVDVGAGIGHLALPLVARGHHVVAVEPALEMLRLLEARAGGTARQHGGQLRGVHAAAEALPLEARSAALAVVADAVHFLDAERAGRELGRVLRARGRLAVVWWEFGPTPFMDAVRVALERAAPRRPRPVEPLVAQLTAVAGARRVGHETFDDATPMNSAQLAGVLRSISYVGPAMAPGVWDAFAPEVEGAAARLGASWARRLTLIWAEVGRR